MDNYLHFMSIQVVVVRQKEATGLLCCLIV